MSVSDTFFAKKTPGVLLQSISYQIKRMCLGTFSRRVRSLATCFCFARVRIIGTLVPFCVIGNSKEFLITQKETTDFTVYLRNSTNPIVSLTLRQAIRFSFSIADQQLCKLLLAICPFQQPNIIITASYFICQPLPGKSSRQIPAATTFSYGTFGSKSAYP